jgi:hypothetical protein
MQKIAVWEFRVFATDKHNKVPYLLLFKTTQFSYSMNIINLLFEKSANQINSHPQIPV